MALLVLLEKLLPTERAVFVLREAFGYSHRDSAQILDITEANARQILHRAQSRLGTDTKSDAAPTDAAQWQELVPVETPGGAAH